MKNEERIVRLNVATEIIGKVHSDICNDSTGNISRKMTGDLCDIIQQLIRFSEALKESKGESE